MGIRVPVSGFGDIGITLTMNLMGAEAMTVEDFQDFRADPRPLPGASLKVVAPTGHYDKDALINVGQNRWATRAQLGTAIPFGGRHAIKLGYADSTKTKYGSNFDQWLITYQVILP